MINDNKPSPQVVKIKTLGEALDSIPENVRGMPVMALALVVCDADDKATVMRVNMSREICLDFFRGILEDAERGAVITTDAPPRMN